MIFKGIAITIIIILSLLVMYFYTVIETYKEAEQGLYTVIETYKEAEQGLLILNMMDQHIHVSKGFDEHDARKKVTSKYSYLLDGLFKQFKDKSIYKRHAFLPEVMEYIQTLKK
jgi:hypothetical protein